MEGKPEYAFTLYDHHHHHQVWLLSTFVLEREWGEEGEWTKEEKPLLHPACSGYWFSFSSFKQPSSKERLVPFQNLPGGWLRYDYDMIFPRKILRMHFLFPMIYLIFHVSIHDLAHFGCFSADLQTFLCIISRFVRLPEESSLKRSPSHARTRTSLLQRCDFLIILIRISYLGPSR